MPFKLTTLNLNLPFGLGGVSVVRTEAQARAAWALYVELATRVSTQPLELGQGSVREALTSIYSLFDITRSVLRDQGPAIAEGPKSVGPLAIRVLNEGVRPFLVKWHTKLSQFESEQKKAWADQYGDTSSPMVDEGAWPELGAFYEELNTWRLDMLEYVKLLAALADIHDDVD